MFSLAWFYELHMYVIVLGVISILSAAYVIRFKKEKKWRIKRHQQLVLLGVTLILTGVSIMLFGKESDGQDHFSVPHAFGGIFTFLLLIITMTLAKLGMRGQKKFIKLHKIFAKISLIVLLLVSFVGLSVFISYI